ncbi:hypothetical protein M406DRAFT_324343 [Cryphonectria parasitica EP155]|uniref:DUF1279 domain-containing protein n=1 Tax=Cryphonectria parasitica (strain ATCC 38755 / EP155) TaxID=660469 RepID=A0A9P4XT80_CRYP1|nr:uncharacterized protein M406DRAFT_324343 [Cryphonectria parasitica EP155]KAF3760486.1 hypothetical protein M406DRAFT_324343 [Cryphonectria parasitica EP155]
MTRATTTLPSPLQRFAAQAWRNTQPRSIHTASGSKRITEQVWRTGTGTSSTPRNPQAWKGTGGTTLSRTQRRNFGWSWARQSQGGGAKQEPSLSFSARMRKLSREYGWAAVGVYLSLSVADFPFCFLLVKWVGTDRIAEFEHWITSNVKKFIPDSVKQQWREWRAEMKGVEKEQIGDNHISNDVEMVGWGVEEAQERHKADASLATQLALAYAIHKSFIFVRVPLTAAVTPKVVKVLRSWGWQIGKRKPKTTR